MPETATQQRQAAVADPGAAVTAEQRLRAHVETLERRLRKRDDQRRAMLHIMGDLSEFNKRLANQRKAMLQDRKSTRLNSSHTVISYAVFCLKKKKKYARAGNSGHNAHQRAAG